MNADDEGPTQQHRPRAAVPSRRATPPVAATAPSTDVAGRRGGRAARHRQRTGEAAGRGHGQHHASVGAPVVPAPAWPTRRRTTDPRGPRRRSSWRASPHAAGAMRRSVAPPPRSCRPVAERLGSACVVTSRPSDVSGPPLQRPHPSTASAQAGDAATATAVTSAGPTEPGDVVGERVPGVDARRPRALARRSRSTPPVSSGSAQAIAKAAASRHDRRTAVEGRRRSPRQPPQWHAAATRSTRHGCVERSSSGPSSGPVASCGNVATAISQPAAAAEPVPVEGQQDEGQGEALADEPGQ